MTLERLDENLYALAHPFRMAGGIELGLRTTAIRLDDGGLWLHSPGPLSQADIAALRELGPVRALVAPNRMHHLYLKDAHAAFPEAALFAAPGMEALLAGLPLAEVLGSEAPPLWKGQIEQAPIEGAERLSEVVFFHPASRTVLFTDFAFNVQRGNRRTALFMKVNAAWQRFGPSRLGRSFMKDRVAVRRSIDRILEWDFDRVIVTHGDVLDGGGHAALRSAFAWLPDTG